MQDRIIAYAPYYHQFRGEIPMPTYIRFSPGRFFLFIIVCIAVSGGSGIAESDVPSDTAPRNGAYLSGREAARSETEFLGSFATGVAFGAAMPFVGGGSAAAMYKVTNGTTICGIAAGISTSVLWTWGGKKLIRRSVITVPDKYRTGFGKSDWNDFSKGYIELAREKQSSRYNFGAVLGVLISVGIAVNILSHMGPFGV
jgi:hypothetical protein